MYRKDILSCTIINLDFNCPCQNFLILFGKGTWASNAAVAAFVPLNCAYTAKINSLGEMILEYFGNAFIKAIQLLLSFDPELYGIIMLSLKVSGIAVIISAAIGIPLGLLIALNKFWGKGVIVNFVNTFMSVPPVVIGLVVYILLSNQMGILGTYRLLFTSLAMVVAQVMLAVPILAGLTIVAIQGVDPNIRKTAISMGATPVQLAVTVVKEARYSIVAAVIVAFGRLMAEVGAVMMVGGNIRFQTRVMTTAIALHKGMGEFQEALALGIILLLISFTINFGLELLRSERWVAR